MIFCILTLLCHQSPELFHLYLTKAWCPLTHSPLPLPTALPAILLSSLWPGHLWISPASGATWRSSFRDWPISLGRGFPKFTHVAARNRISFLLKWKHRDFCFFLSSKEHGFPVRSLQLDSRVSVHRLPLTSQALHEPELMPWTPSASFRETKG